MSNPPSPYDRPFGGSVEKRALYEYHLAMDCILPLLTRWGVKLEGARVLDLGCGTGGLTVAMAESDAQCWGVDLRPERIAHASQMAADHGVTVHLVAGNILELGNFAGAFDLIVLSEVVEHLGDLANVAVLLRWCRDHLSRKGRIYVSFPPWYGPFAGHQAGWPRIRSIPWYHLLPDAVKQVLAPARAPAYLEFAQELNQLTIGAFEKCLREGGVSITHKALYLIRPEFRFRYGLPEMRLSLLEHVPVVREIMTTGAYYLLGDGAGCQGDDLSRSGPISGLRGGEGDV